VVDHERVDFVLRDVFCAAALADVDSFSGWRGKREDGFGNEVVVEDDLGGLDEAERANGEEFGVAGACAY
jgi:hypothetical protein